MEKVAKDLLNLTQQYRDVIYALLKRHFQKGRPFLLKSDLESIFTEYCNEHPELNLQSSILAEWSYTGQEAALHEPWAYFALRPQIGQWQYIRIHAEELIPENITVDEYLAFKDFIVRPDLSQHDTLIIDFAPFNLNIPKMTEPHSIGQGVSFLNRRLAGEIFQDLVTGDMELVHFLHMHKIDGKEVMLSRRFSSIAESRQALRQARRILQNCPPHATWEAFGDALEKLGFAPGWGKTAERCLDTITLFMDILEAPDSSTLEEFLSRIPMITKLLILSPHGYFGQANVLGLPDTGGQVVYILDQVRALEQEMLRHLDEGIDITPKIIICTRLIPDARGTTCNQRLEKVLGCNHTHILRVPFHHANGEIIQEWVSRFAIWPYLHRFAEDVEREVTLELGGRPDLIIGNYSDGNLVATLLAQRLGVTQCNIAHALEKTKYLLSDLYWADMDHQYHFSAQYTADLIAMNSADFIITSTFQEIAGTPDVIGQYESYQSFTMPGLCRVRNGVELFDPKFNIVSPGADDRTYFPYTSEKRFTALIPEVEALIFGGEDPHARGVLKEPEKPLVFSLARLDRIKNLTGLVEWYAKNDKLRQLANLLIVGGFIDPQQSGDHEEQQQIEKMHELFSQYGLEQQVRWLGMRLDKPVAGEMYRVVADHQGVFVQPALFEAFGLTLIEAMASGLPTFATCYGGPREIIEHGRSGFHIDPNQGEQAAQMIADFIERYLKDTKEWNHISEGALARVAARYTWKRYAQRLLTLSRVYGFWKYVSNLEREELKRYLHMFYQLQFRPLSKWVTGES